MEASKVKRIFKDIQDKQFTERMNFIYNKIKDRSNKQWSCFEYTLLPDEIKELEINGYFVIEKQPYDNRYDKARHVIQW
jgi:hypothetical protein